MNRSRRTRQLRMALAGAAVAALALAASTIAGAENTASGTAAGATDTLVVGVPDDAATFDPVFANTTRSTHVILNTYDTFMTYALKPAKGGVRLYDPKRPVGLLFQSMKASKDGRTWTLTLKRGVKFPDGSPVDAKALMFAIQRNMGVKEGGGAFLWKLIGRIGSAGAAKQTGPYTVRLRTQGPNPMLPFIFALSNAVLWNPKVVQERGGSGDPWATKWLARNTSGVGPYQLQRWTPGSEIVLTAAPGSPGPRPAIKTVQIKEIPSSATRILLLQRGSLDLIERLSPDEVESLQGKPGVRVISVPSNYAITLVMNPTKAPFDKVAVRRAISHAVPYRDIIRNVFHGRARTTAGPVPRDFPNHTSAGYPYKTQNLARAKQLLESAGQGGGFAADLVVDAGNPVHEAVAVQVQSALRQIGVRTNIRKLTPAVFAEQRQKHNLAFFLTDTTWWVADPAYAIGLGYTCGAFFNYGAYCNKQVDAQLKRASFETNRGKRTRMFNALQRQIWNDAPMVWITQPNFNLATRSNVTGYAHFIDEMVRFRYFKKR